MKEALFGLQEPYKEDTYYLHPEAYQTFLEFQSLASQDDIDLQVASGFRSFERQKIIWNKKAAGEKEILDSNSRPLRPSDLSPQELVFAILRWSALPGFSRHHWGSDFDVYDAKALKEGETFDLIPSEYETGGVFEKLGTWLSQNLTGDFYRPYEKDLGGVAREPWHLSYRPLADEYKRELSFEEGLNFLKSDHCSDLIQREIVIDHFKEIYERFIINAL